MENLKEAISLMLAELITKAASGDLEAASEIADVIDGQVAEIIEIASGSQAMH